MDDYEQVYEYLCSGTYPEGFSKNQKKVLRRKCLKNFKVEREILYYSREKGKGKDACWRQVPRNAREVERILKSCHSALEGGHLGRDKTVEKISARFYWKSLWTDVKEYVKRCDTCQRTNDVKLQKSSTPLHPVSVRSKVWNKVGIDLVGPLPRSGRGNRYAVTLVDYFSKWPEAEGIPDKSAKSVALFLYRMICRYGCCKVVISDQGREFVNKINRNLFKLTQTEHRVSSAYHPQTNGLVERFNQTLQRSLVKFVNNNQTDWDEKLDGFLFAYRTSQQKSSSYTPFELMYCRKAILPIEMELKDSQSSEDSHEEEPNLEPYVKKMVMMRDNIFANAKENIISSQFRQKIDYDKKHGRKKDIKVGKMVLLRNSARDGRKGDKLAARWLGPYRVKENLGKGVYRLVNPASGHVLKKAVNRCRLKLKPTPVHLSCNDVFQLGSDSDHSILSPPPAKRNHDDLSPDAIRSDGDEFVPPAAANSPSDAADYSPGSSDFFLSISTLEMVMDPLLHNYLHKPIGPLGPSIRVKNIEWEYAVNQLIKNSTLYSSFIVDNYGDADKLRDALRAAYQDHPIPEVIVSQFQDSVYDVKKNRPKCTYPTVLEMLNVDHNIANVLIDQLQVESILLIPTIAEAKAVISQESPSEEKAIFVYTIDGFPYTHYSTKKCDDIKNEEFGTSRFGGICDPQEKLSPVKIGMEPPNSGVPQDREREAPSAELPQISSKTFTKDCSSIGVDGYPVKPTTYWIKELCLNLMDEADLLCGNNWLTDKHIAAANKLLTDQFPTQAGLQSSVILSQYLTYESSGEDFVQIVNIANDHWVCVSNLLSSPGVVEVYDSMPHHTFNSSTLRQQVAAIIKTEEKDFELRHVDAQRQAGGTDCALFAIAFCTTLCMSGDPHTSNYQQSEMRCHLYRCFQNQKMLPFPVQEKHRRLGRRRTIHRDTVAVFCKCRMPWNKYSSKNGPLVRCQICKEWFHQLCMDIEQKIVDYPVLKYNCKLCLGILD